MSALNSFSPQLLHGYASALAELAELVGGMVPAPEAVVSTSETLTEKQREVIEARLGGRVCNEYGSQEGQHLVQECVQRGMHIHPARGIVELLNFATNDPVRVGEQGRVVVTGLHARAMPLIRYDLGDAAVSTGFADDCRCGSGWPTIGTVLGRTEDLVKLRDGRRVGMLSYSTLRDARGVREAQIIQSGYESFVYRIVPAEGLERASTEDHIRRELQSRLGIAVSVRFEYVADLERGPSGKLRAVQVTF